YTWGWQRKQEDHRETGRCPSALQVHRKLHALKQTDVPGIYAVSKCAPQEAVRTLDRAFDRFFDRFFDRVELKKAGTLQGKLGYPKRKRKKRGLGSFRVTGTIVVFPNALQLPRLGRLRLQERGDLPTTGSPDVRMLSVTVAEQAGHWYVAVLVEQE